MWHAHPRATESPNLRSDRERLAQKLEVADFAVTQFFFDIDHYLSMVNDLADLGSTKPVVPARHSDHECRSGRPVAAMAGATSSAPLAAPHRGRRRPT
ncbi:MAG: methylenetetrahydrofolate reductase [Acidimicrobiales bacterium]